MRSRLLIIVLALAGAVVAAPAGAQSAPVTTAGPTAEVALSGLVQVQAGDSLSCGRTSTGQVRCWGENDDGELGNGNTTPHQFAVPVRAVSGPGNLTGVTQIAVGDDHACALLSNRQIRCWGDDEYGELGNGLPLTDASRPVAVRNGVDTANLQNVVAISAESDGACALLANGELRCWGNDDYGQLGNGLPEADSSLPVTVQNVAGTGSLTNVRSIEMGYDNNCAVLSNGQGRCWGYNSNGVLGNDDTADTARPVVVQNLTGTGPLTGVTQISIGGYDGCARLANGQARCWGYNGAGEVGDGTTTPRHRPVIVLDGSGSSPLAGVRQIHTSEYHTCALLTTGQVRCWGETIYGDLGDGTVLTSGPDRLLPRVVKVNATTRLTDVRQIHHNSFTTCAVLDSGRARCWGRNDAGQVGNGGMADRNFATLVQT